MALIPCKECHKDVSSEAAVCPHCGISLIQKENKARGCLTGAAVVGGIFVLLLVLIAAIGGGQPSKSISAEEHAWNVCEAFIQKSLRDPSSADFMTDYSPTLVSRTNNGDYSVAMKVRAANGFGGKTVSIFNCEAKPTGGDNWSLVNLHEIN